MELREILGVVWKRWWLILLGTVLVCGLVFVMSKRMRPVYQARVTMMVNQSTNAPFADYTSMLSGENLALTYSELLKTRPLLETVIANLNLDLSPDDLIKDKIGTDLVPNTQLLALTVEDTDPQRASDIANEIAFTFISLHNTEKQLENIVALEQDVVTQLAELKALMEQNQAAVEKSRVSPGLLTEEERNLLQTTLSSQQSAYAGLLGTFLNVRLTQAQLLDVTVVEPAVPPRVPVRPNVMIYSFLGAFIGFLLGTGGAFLLEYLDRSFETGEDVAQVLSLPSLGIIPRLRQAGEQKGLVASTLPRSPVSEAYRTLRTNIRFASVDEPLKTLLITSAEPGAGKSTTAANLGVVCAQAGLRVVLIDTDLRRPRLHQLFAQNNHAGLTDLLVGNVEEATDCMIETATENLHLIASGPIPPNPSELLGSKRMETVLAQVRENADLVILDTPPTLAVTDAAVLAAKVEGVLLLLETKQTSHEAARQAYQALRRVGAPVLGVALTKAKVGNGSSYYYYAEETKSIQHPVWRLWLGKVIKALRI